MRACGNEMTLRKAILTNNLSYREKNMHRTPLNYAQVRKVLNRFCYLRGSEPSQGPSIIRQNSIMRNEGTLNMAAGGGFN